MVHIYMMADKLSCLGVLENDKPGDVTLPSLDVCIIQPVFRIFDAAHNFATLPVSTATAERSFSVLITEKCMTCAPVWVKNVQALSHRPTGIHLGLYSDSF